MRWWSIGALSPTSRRSVAEWFPSMRQSFGDGLQTSPTCLRVIASFRDKCLKRSVRLLKMIKRDLLAIQGPVLPFAFSLSVVCTPSWQHFVALWFTLCRRSNCNCPVVNILKIFKEMVRLWKASFLYAFVLIENRSTVSHRPVTAQL